MQYLRRSMFLLAGGLVFGQGKKPDYSGRWVMDESRSEMGHKMRAGGYSEVFDIHHDEPRIRIDYAVSFQGETRRVVYDLTTDGRECRTRTPMGEEVSRTIWSGGSLMTESTVNAGTPRESRWVLSLSPDGREMYVQYGKSAQPKKLVFTNHRPELH